MNAKVMINFKAVFRIMLMVLTAPTAYLCRTELLARLHALTIANWHQGDLKAEHINKAKSSQENPKILFLRIFQPASSNIHEEVLAVAFLDSNEDPDKHKNVILIIFIQWWWRPRKLVSEPAATIYYFILYYLRYYILKVPRDLKYQASWRDGLPDRFK